jgi:hypothetical protein
MTVFVKGNVSELGAGFSFGFDRGSLSEASRRKFDKMSDGSREFVTNTFTLGPALSGVVTLGSLAIPNLDGTVTIVHGGNLTTSSLYDPVRQVSGIMPAGPTLATAANCGAWAIPLRNGTYKFFHGAAVTSDGLTTAQTYDPRSKIFTNNTTYPLTTNPHGCGSFVLQRADGFWISFAGNGKNTTNIINPENGQTAVGPTIGTAGPTGTSPARDSGVMIPRSDGTFFIPSASSTQSTNIYVPWGTGPAASAGSGASQLGASIAGPNMQGGMGSGSISFQRPDGKFVVLMGWVCPNSKRGKRFLKQIQTQILITDQMFYRRKSKIKS